MAPIVLAFVTAVLAASLFLWWNAIDRWRSGEPLLPAASHPSPGWDLLDVGIAVGCWLGFNVAAIFAIQGLLHLPAAELDSLGVDDQKTALLVLELANLATCAVVALIFRIRHKLSLRDLGWDARYLFQDVLLGLKAFAMLVPIVYGLQFVLTQLVDSKHPLIEMLKENPDPAFFAVAAFAAVIAAPITEEFFFRVVLQGWLERVFSDRRNASDELGHGTRPETVGLDSPSAASEIYEAKLVTEPFSEPATSHPFGDQAAPTPAFTPANENKTVSVTKDARPSFWPIAGSSLVFAISHWSHGPDPIPLFVFAVGLGYLYQRTNRILPSIVLHLLLNLCSLIALGMSLNE